MKKIKIDKNITKYCWNKAGKTTVIMAWVHGNEKSGVRVFEQLRNIEIDAWIVYFIIANSEALALNKRFVEKNMNRCFVDTPQGNSYEEKRAQEIIPYLRKANYLLDLHNTTIQKSEAFLICEYPEIAKYFPVQKVVSGFDVIQPGWSDEFMNSIGKCWICLECWSIYDSGCESLAKNSVLNFLKFTGNISWTVLEFDAALDQKYIRFDTLYKNTSSRFRFNKIFADFEEVAQWQLLGQDWDKKILAPYDGTILFPEEADEIWKEIFCMGSMFRTRLSIVFLFLQHLCCFFATTNTCFL